MAAALVQPHELVAVFDANCRLIIRSAGAALGAGPVTSPIEKVGDAEVLIGRGFTAFP